MFSTGFTSLSVSLLFLYRSPSSSLCTVFDSISSTIDEVLLINPSANVFVFRDFNVHYEDWITYYWFTWLVELIDLVNSVIIFQIIIIIVMTIISNDLTQMVNFSTWISPTLLNFFLFSDASICSTMAFPL